MERGRERVRGGAEGRAVEKNREGEGVRGMPSSSSVTVRER